MLSIILRACLAVVAVVLAAPLPAEGQEVQEVDPWPGASVREETGLVESDGLAAGMLLNLSAGGPCSASPTVYNEPRELPYASEHARIEAGGCGWVRLNGDGRIVAMYVETATGPISSVDWRVVSGLTELTQLTLDGERHGPNPTPPTGLTGTIPVELANLTNLRELDMMGHYLSGPIPAAFGLMPNLISLQLDFNDLTGPISPALVNIEERRRSLGLMPWNAPYFDIHFNNLTGPIPAGLYEMNVNPQWGGRELSGGREP